MVHSRLRGSHGDPYPSYPYNYGPFPSRLRGAEITQPRPGRPSAVHSRVRGSYTSPVALAVGAYGPFPPPREPPVK
ncbi:hypothetical protein GCM10027440_38080 [Nocardiopsis coralliicola]